MKTPIRATDEALLDARREDVWRVLADVARYPEWYPRQLKLAVRRAEPGTVGSEIEMRPYGGRAFCCRYEAVDAPSSLRVRYFGGFIEGTGEWRLLAEGERTRVVYDCDVVALGLMAALAGKVVALAPFHSREMKGVLEALGRRASA